MFTYDINIIMLHSTPKLFFTFFQVKNSNPLGCYKCNLRLPPSVWVGRSKPFESKAKMNNMLRMMASGG